MARKISGMVKRCYLEEGRVSSSLDYFAVPKGDLDVRVVFDGLSCGLNKALWAPNFCLPSASSAIMLLSFSTWMAEMDLVKCFTISRWRKNSGNAQALSGFQKAGKR